MILQQPDQPPALEATADEQGWLLVAMITPTSYR